MERHPAVRAKNKPIGKALLETLNFDVSSEGTEAGTVVTILFDGYQYPHSALHRSDSCVNHRFFANPLLVITASAQIQFRQARFHQLIRYFSGSPSRLPPEAVRHDSAHLAVKRDMRDRSKKVVFEKECFSPAKDNHFQAGKC